jgi:hypothetical protein
LQVDEWTSRGKDYLMKWQNGKMARWQNGKMANGKMAK